MPYAVSWRLMFRANNAAAAEHCLARVLGCMTATLREPRKPYWKRPELWEVSLDSTFASPVADGVLSLLVDANALATGWLIMGPLIVDDEIRVFEGIFNVGPGRRPHIAGLEWGWFDVDQLSAASGE